MRAIGDNLRHILATEMRHCNNSHCGHTEWMIKTYLRQSHECRTIVARIIGECFTTFSRHSCDIRETLARCSRDEIANIYDHRTPHDVLGNVVRQSRECRATVARQSRDGFARNANLEKINILASIETSD